MISKVKADSVTLIPSEEKRFWSKVDRAESNQCWIWRSGVNNHGYGRFVIYRQSEVRLLAHRLAYRITFGAIPAGAALLHKCDTPACVNPNHLRPGTQRENLSDARAKGRMSDPPLHRGEGSAVATLTEAQVREIHARYLAGGISQRALAAAYRVEQPTIGAIVRAKTWRHLGLPAIHGRGRPAQRQVAA